MNIIITKINGGKYIKISSSSNKVGLNRNVIHIKNIEKFMSRERIYNSYRILLDLDGPNYTLDLDTLTYQLIIKYISVYNLDVIFKVL